jgi:hypothetical protein
MAVAGGGGLPVQIFERVLRMDAQVQTPLWFLVFSNLILLLEVILKYFFVWGKGIKNSDCVTHVCCCSSSVDISREPTKVEDEMIEPVQ